MPAKRLNYTPSLLFLVPSLSIRPPPTIPLSRVEGQEKAVHPYADRPHRVTVVSGRAETSSNRTTATIDAEPGAQTNRFSSAD